MLAASWGMFRDHPLLGVGPGNFAEHLARYVPEGRRIEHEFPHNFVAQVGAETGVIGLATLLWWGASVLGVCFRAARRAAAGGAGEGASDLALGGAAGVVAAAVGSLFGYPFMHGVWEPLVYALTFAAAEVAAEAVNRAPAGAAATINDVRGVPA